MNGPVQKKKAISLTQPLSRRAMLVIAGSLGMAVLLASGGYWAYQRYSSRTLTAAEERELIRKYLRKQTGLKEFKTTATAEVPPPMPMLSNPIVTDQMMIVTNAAGLKKPRRRNVPFPPNEFSSAFRRQVNEAHDYKTIYRLIGEQLWLADQRLASPEPQQKETGVLLAVEASRVALNDAMNAWLAARICVAYLWPALDMTNTPRLNMDMWLDTSEQAFKGAAENDNLIRTYKMYLSKNGRAPRADTIRTRLAKFLADQAQYAEALNYLRELRSTNSPVIQQRIASLEQQLTQKKSARN